jgi:hypothetical protein
MTTLQPSSAKKLAAFSNGVDIPAQEYRAIKTTALCDVGN